MRRESTADDAKATLRMAMQAFDGADRLYRASVRALQEASSERQRRAAAWGIGAAVEALRGTAEAMKHAAEVCGYEEFAAEEKARGAQ